MQVGLAEVVPRAAPVLPPPMPDGPVLVITTRPAELAVRLTATGRTVLGPGDAEERWTGPGVAVVGSPQSWQHRWQQLGRARTDLDALVDRVGTADLRTLLGGTAVLPPVDGPDEAVLLPPEGAPVRIRLA